MTDIPRAVLSEHFQLRMKGRRLVSAIFTTFRFEPGFFETEVLPVFLDVPLSHASALRLLQLEDALRSLPGSIAVYYDQHGLVADGGSAKLDIRRMPIRHTAIFHPKNVLALVEELQPDDNGQRARSLLCACLSANLTRAGWWENVEVGHIEEISAGDHTSLREPVMHYVNRLVTAAEGRPANDELRAAHGAAHDIREFLRGTTQREHRSIDGRLCTQFHAGLESLPEFLTSVTGGSLRGLCLEVISPYFDAGGESAPLAQLLEYIEPSEVRVLLPRDDSGEALCSEELYAWVRAQPNVTWASLPGDLLKRGAAADAKHRSVHAKVYRFFEPKRGGRVVLYVGSANLTRPGFLPSARGGNWETGFVVEATSAAQPDFWLEPDKRQPLGFAPRDEGEDTASSGGTRLMLRYRWDTKEGSAFWWDTAESPVLTVQCGGIRIFELTSLRPRLWTALEPEQTALLAQTLVSTSLLEVVGDGDEPGLLLVQEEGMHQRPSVASALSAAEILRYWSLLTIEQRAAFLETRVRVAQEDDPLLAKFPPLPVETTLFDRFAGIFHAFECLRDNVCEALEAGTNREADYRLFGKKFDSLGCLLERLLEDIAQGHGDHVEHYVTALCAKQLVRDIIRDFPDYCATHRDEVKALQLSINRAEEVRITLAETSPELPEFFGWFERWFLLRAKGLQTEESA